MFSPGTARAAVAAVALGGVLAATATGAAAGVSGPPHRPGPVLPLIPASTSTAPPVTVTAGCAGAVPEVRVTALPWPTAPTGYTLTVAFGGALAPSTSPLAVPGSSTAPPVYVARVLTGAALHGEVTVRTSWAVLAGSGAATVSVQWRGCAAAAGVGARPGA